MAFGTCFGGDFIGGNGDICPPIPHMNGLIMMVANGYQITHIRRKGLWQKKVEVKRREKK